MPLHSRVGSLEPLIKINFVTSKTMAGPNEIFYFNRQFSLSHQMTVSNTSMSFILWKARVRCGVVGVADGDGSGVRGGGSCVGGCSRVMRGR